LTPRLVLIVPEERLGEQGLDARIERALNAGVDAVLLRAPSLPDAALLAWAARLRALCRRARARFFVHSRFEIAEAVGADGVHLPARFVRRLAQEGVRVRAGRLVSAAAHDAEELASAAAIGCSFAFLSPVFPTKTHPERQALGIERFIELAEGAPLKVVALGGIDAANRAQLPWPSVAAISAILDAPSPEEAVRALLRAPSSSPFRDGKR